MALKKCPKCELNYIKNDEQYCNVCMREMKKAISRHKQEEEEAEIIMCTECGEAPAVKGGELCAECLREAKRQTELENATELGVDFDEDDEDDEDIEDDGDDE